MKHLNRKVNVKILTINTILYRIWIIIENALFLWLVGVLTGWYGVKVSFIISLLWNIINMVTYWLWHYFLYKWFKMGKE